MTIISSPFDQSSSFEIETKELFAQCLQAFHAFGNLVELAEDMRVLSLNAELAAGRAGDKGASVRVLTQYTRELVYRLNSTASQIAELKAQMDDYNVGTGSTQGQISTPDSTSHSVKSRQAGSDTSADVLADDTDAQPCEFSETIASVSDIVACVNSLSDAADSVTNVGSQAASISTNIAIEAALSGEFEAEFSQVSKAMQGYVGQLRTMADSAARTIHGAVSIGQGLQQRASRSLDDQSMSRAVASRTKPSETPLTGSVPAAPTPSDGPFTFRQIELVQSTFAEVAKIKEAAADLFYGRLFEMDPALKPLFSGDMKAQGKALMGMIATAVAGLNKLDTIVPAVQDLGVRHAGYGVKDKDYDTVAGALLWTLEQGLGDLYTPDVADAWTAVYTVLATTMKDAAKAALEDTEGNSENHDGSLVIKQDASLFARLGGEPAIDILVDSFYSRVVDDPRISDIFENADVSRLKADHKSRLAATFGNPDAVADKSYDGMHTLLMMSNSDNSHAGIAVEHFLAILKDFQVDGGMIEEIMGIL